MQNMLNYFKGELKKMGLIGENILKYRKANKLTQKQLAEKCKMTQQQIAQYETGKRIPKIDTLVRIAIALTRPEKKKPEKGLQN